MHDVRQRPREPSGSRAERVRARQLEDAPAVVEADPRRGVERSAWRPRRQERRPRGGGGAVDVAELGDRASTPRRDTSPRRRRSAARARVRAASGPREALAPPGRRRSAERASATSSGCDARTARAPQLLARARRTLLVLAFGRRSHQRGDREAARPAPREAAVAVPHLVVERPFDVARHDRVALCTGHVRDLRTPRQGRARPGSGRAHERGDRTSRPDHAAVGASAVRARLPAALDHRSGDRRPARRERARRRRLCLQRRALQLRELRGSSRRRPRDARHRRHAADPACSTSNGASTSPSGSRACSRSRSGTCARAARARPRPARQEAAPLAQLPDGSLAFASETKALLALPSASARARPCRSSMRTSRSSTSRARACGRSRRCRPGRTLVVENGGVQRRALLAPCGA